MKCRLTLALAAFLPALACNPRAFGATYTWTQAAGGAQSWTTGANWSAGLRSNGVDLRLNNATHVAWTSSTSSSRLPFQGGTAHLQTSGLVDYLRVTGNVFANRVSVPGVHSVVYGNAMP